MNRGEQLVKAFEILVKLVELKKIKERIDKFDLQYKKKNFKHIHKKAYGENEVLRSYYETQKEKVWKEAKEITLEIK